MITVVTASGWEIMITCEPSISVILAPARTAIERTTSAPAARSPVATTAHGRTVFPRRWPGRLGEREFGDRPLRCSDPCNLLVVEIACEGVADLRWVDGEFRRRSAVRRRVLPRDKRGVQDAVFRVRFGCAERLALFGGERRYVDEADDVLCFGRSVRDHGPAVGVAHGHNLSFDLGEDCRDVRRVGGDSTEWVRGGDQRDVIGPEPCDHAVPARRIGERPVDEDNCWFRHLCSLHLDDLKRDEH